MKENIIEFANVVKSFDGVKVLDGLSFAIRRGEIICLTGPSGTGKSVTLKHIVGLLEPDAGKVVVAGKDLAECSREELAAVRDRIGYLFQSGALLAWMLPA